MSSHSYSLSRCATLPVCDALLRFGLGWLLYVRTCSTTCAHPDALPVMEKQWRSSKACRKRMVY